MKSVETVDYDVVKDLQDPNFFTINELLKEKNNNIIKLVSEMDQKAFPGTLEALAKKMVDESTPILEEIIEFTDEFKKVLDDPYAYFETDDINFVRTHTTMMFMEKIHFSSPVYYISAMIAHVEFGLKNYSLALEMAMIAQNEKEFGGRIDGNIHLEKVMSIMEETKSKAIQALLTTLK